MSECQRLKIAFPVYAQRVPQPQATVFHTKYEGPFCRILLRCILVEEKLFFSLSLSFPPFCISKGGNVRKRKKGQSFPAENRKVSFLFLPPTSPVKPDSKILGLKKSGRNELVFLERERRGFLLVWGH